MSIVQMEAEWTAWTRAGVELRKLGIAEGWDSEDAAVFHAAVLAWSERLVGLRVGQSPEMRARALAEAESRLLRAVEKRTQARLDG